MIAAARIKPDSVVGKLLRIIVDEPAEYDAAALRALVLPPMSFPFPWRNAAERRAWLHLCSEVTITDERLVIRGLGKLQGAGLIERQIAPLIAQWFLNKPGSTIDKLRGAGLDRERDWRLHAQIVERVAIHPTSLKVAHGARQRAYRELVERGVVVAPSRRVPTPAGVDLVESWRAF